ncbi:MAG: TetR/AcrR family transcriptional regulator [Propionibacteriaceae bacterium]
MSDPADPALPRAVALTWGIAANPQRGPKRELSHERIVEEAMAIADAEGLAAVTMSRVAKALGFTTMSLYRYVTSKDELLMLMQEGAAAIVVPPDTEDGDWRSGLRTVARLLRGVYRDHPWFTEIPVSIDMLMTPNNLTVADLALRALRGTNLSVDHKMAILVSLSGYVRSVGLLTEDLTEQGQVVDPAPEHLAALQELVTPERFPDLAPVVSAGDYLAADEPGEDPDAVPDADVGADFDFGLERFLDGIGVFMEQRAEAGTDAADDPPPAPATELEVDAVRRDRKVKDAVRARREAESRLREAKAKEREAIKRAVERAGR